MKHVKLKIALLAATAVTFGLALVGCGPSNAKYDYKVTFDYNISVWQCENEECGEVFFAMERPEKCSKCKDGEVSQYTGDDLTSIKNRNKYLQYLGTHENSLIVKYPDDENEDQHLPLQTIEDYEFDGWYFPKTENGEIVIDGNGRVVAGEKVDFTRYRVTGDVTLYASFVKKHSLTVLGRNAQGEELTLKREIAYRGAVGKTLSEPIEGTVAEVEGYSLVEYYKDEALTEIFPFPYTFGEEDETVYAKFLEGEWAAVTAPANTAGSSKVVNGFDNALSKNMNIYLRRDLDYTGRGWTPRNYSGVILGNGHTVSNIAFTRKSTMSAKEFSPFGKLGDTFEVHELAFENVTLNITMEVGGIHQISAFAESISSEAVFDRFQYQCTVNIEREKLGVNAIPTIFEICKAVPETLDKTMFTVTVNGE